MQRNGYTLVECVVVLALVGLLVSIGLSTVGEVLQSLRLTAVSNDVFSHLVLARSEAIRRNTRVALCKSGGGERCRPAARWEEGALLFADRNNNAQHDPGEPVVQRLPALPAGLRLLANTPVATYVSFGPYGRAQTTSGAFQAGTFTLCRAGGGEARLIVLNAGGRPRVQRVWVERCA